MVKYIKKGIEIKPSFMKSIMQLSNADFCQVFEAIWLVFIFSDSKTVG